MILKKSAIKFLRRKNGITLMEVMVSIMILSIIVIAFFPLFSQTAISVRKSEKIVDASYVAQSVLETYYNNSRNPESPLPADSVRKFPDEWGKGYWVVSETSAIGSLVKVLVRVYSDDSEETLESQMELHLIWH